MENNNINLELNYKKFYNGVDLIFNRELSNKEENNFFMYIEKITDNTLERENHNQYYVSNIENIEKFIMDFASVFDIKINKGLEFENKPFDVYYNVLEEDFFEEYWVVCAIMKNIYDEGKCLLTGFNYRLYDFMMANGFNSYEDSNYEHDLMFEDIEKGEQVIRELKNLGFYNFIKNYELE